MKWRQNVQSRRFSMDARLKPAHDEVMESSRENSVYRTTPEIQHGRCRGTVTLALRKQRAAAP